MRLILVRHGQTPANVIGSLDTALPGPGLTELGHAQAAALPQHLAHEPIELAYASTHIRTQLTGAPLATSRGLETQIRAGLRELSAGDLEGRNDPEAVDRFHQVMASWFAGHRDLQMPGGETAHEVIDRFDQVIDEIAQSGSETAVAFSHSGAIRLWASAKANNLATDFPMFSALGNSGIVVMRGGVRGWVCESWNPEPVVHELSSNPPTDPIGSKLEP